MAIYSSLWIVVLYHKVIKMYCQAEGWMLKTAGESSEQVLAVTFCDASAVIRAMFPCLMSVMQQPLDTLHLHNTQTRDTYRNSAPQRRHGQGRGSGAAGSRRRCRTPGTWRPGPAEVAAWPEAEAPRWPRQPQRAATVAWVETKCKQCPEKLRRNVWKLVWVKLVQTS